MITVILVISNSSQANDIPIRLLIRFKMSDKGKYKELSTSEGHSSTTRNLWLSLKKTVIILTSTVVVLAALRNSITYHLQHFWGASGNFWQQQWDKVLTIENDQRMLWVYGTMVTSIATYWGLGGLYTFMDVTNFPAYFRRYKVQPGINEPVDTWKLIKCIFWVNFNLTIVSAPFLEAGYFLMQLRGYDDSPQLPTFQRVLFQLVICTVIQEIGFYYLHRLFHHRRLYKYIHKMHHEWQSPISVTAAYAHPAEHLVVNLSPLFLGPLVVGMHVATFWLWGVLGVIYTLVSHSGYHLPFLFSPELHDYHHLKFDQNYGTLGVLDFLHGTDARFRTSKQFVRHITTMTLQPVREIIPDDLIKGELSKNKKR